jgi:hypothetical protein
VPIPLKETLWGEPPALSATDTTAAREPSAEGVNVNEIVQFPFALRELPQLFVCAKSPEFDPAIVIVLIVRVCVPEFVNVTVCTLLTVLMLWFPKLTPVCPKLTPGPSPVPRSGMSKAPLVTLASPLKGPPVVG